LATAVRLFAAAGVVTTAIGLAWADVEVTVCFTRVSDSGKQENVRTLTIGNNGKVNASSLRAVAFHDSVHTLGAPELSNAPAGEEYVFRYTIRDGKIIVASFFHSYGVVMTITTDGRSRRHATREYGLNPGFDCFQEKPDSPRLTNIHAENVACEIAEVR